ncbi:hypothetical protein Vafri_6155 [Volvox africanus]|uniref:RING-type E3 ubiquitin transferase n=2 Tax=Volvox africanus TaxID=51714 RepID=A0A8J4AXE6_9CHLO|nr:hypothetical protein Vafri_6155 [Volvox africanus]
MSDKSKVLCKYHVSGVCRFGADCAFSHDLTDLPNLVCKYYLAGCCAYGDHCRYDHKRPDYLQAQRVRSNQPGSQQQLPARPTGVAATAATTPPGRPPASAAAAAAAPSPPATAAVTVDLPTTATAQRRRTLGGGSSGGRGSGGGGSSSGLRSEPLDSTGVTPNPQKKDVFRLPRTLSGDSIATAGGSAGGAGASLAGAGASGQIGGSGSGAIPDLTAAAAGSPGPYVPEGGQYDEYGMYGEEGEAAFDNGCYQAYYAYEFFQGDEGGEYGDAEMGLGYHEEGGLTIVDDDVGLVQEQELARAAAAGSRRAVVAGDAAAMPPFSRWAAPLHPWEGGAATARSSGGGNGERGHGWSGAGTARMAAEALDVLDPADVELCPGFLLHGRCAAEEDCPLIHGLECEICQKFTIHPYNAEAAEEHRTACQLRHERLEARLRSGEVECGICLERVLSKSSVAERRFGLMSCDHAFCLACIRSWRGRNDDVTLATDTAVRTCPICRTPTHFVTPSLVWPASAEEKAGIVAAYKEKLCTIDCKHFNFGQGTCPFSTSCFYRHMYKDGRMEEPVLRRAGNADGDVRVVMPVRLSAFFDTPHAQRLLRRR